MELRSGFVITDEEEHDTIPEDAPEEFEEEVDAGELWDDLNDYQDQVLHGTAERDYPGFSTKVENALQYIAAIDDLSDTTEHERIRKKIQYKISELESHYSMLMKLKIKQDAVEDERFKTALQGTIDRRITQLNDLMDEEFKEIEVYHKQVMAQIESGKGDEGDMPLEHVEEPKEEKPPAEFPQSRRLRTIPKAPSERQTELAENIMGAWMLEPETLRNPTGG